MSALEIDVLHELEHVGIAWEPAGEEQIKLRCPAHDDKNPSASLNTKTQLWKCHVPSCAKSGDLVSLIAYYMKVPRQVALSKLQERHPEIKGISSIPSQTIEKYHAMIWEAGPLLDGLRKRGVTDDLIRKARLGFWNGRVTIPIWDDNGNAVNVKHYLPGASGSLKMRSTPGHAGPHLYQCRDVRDAGAVWVCGGEMKALVAGAMLAGTAAAVSSTGGEGTWKPEWTDLLKDKDVYVCMDIDDPGLAATRKVCAQLWSHVKSLRVVRLPLDPKTHPKGDINDWVGQCGAVQADFLAAMQSAYEWAPPTKQIQPKGKPKKLDLRDASVDSRVGEFIEVKAVVAASDQTPYRIPRVLDIECDRSQPGCHVCPVKLENEDPDTGMVTLEIEPGAPAILGMIGENEKMQPERVRDALGIPTCKSVKFHAKEHHVVHDVRVSPPMDFTVHRGGDAWYPAVVVGGPEVELNVPFLMHGSVYPHPKTQQATLLVSDYEETEDSLMSFAPTGTELNALEELFKPESDSEKSLDDKLSEVYSDLEANVTWIFKRRDMHVAMDAAWHSPLLFDFDGRQVNGWMNVLVLGDSSQGKSECAHRLLQHYGCGDKVDCKNVTVAGLLGGLEQMGNRWFVKWGSIPQNDRALVILEELKGAPIEVLSKLTDMRSSGIAEIPKIERRRALARTRILMLSNPRSPRSLSSYHFGIEAVHELLGNLEDVRRIDLAVALSKDDVDEDDINTLQANRPVVEHKATSAVCRRLVLWAWTRKSEDVKFDDEATSLVISETRMLCQRFSEAVPLVDKGSMKLKLARLAAAIAARTFSSIDGKRLDVVGRHVRWASRFIERVYSTPAMGYSEFSAAQHMMSTIQEPDVVLKTLRKTKYPADLVSVLLRRDTISIEDIQSACERDIDGARMMLSLLVRKGALLRINRNEYAKNPELITLLKKMRADPSVNAARIDIEGDEF